MALLDARSTMAETRRHRVRTNPPNPRGEDTWDFGVFEPPLASIPGIRTKIDEKLLLYPHMHPLVSCAPKSEDLNIIFHKFCGGKAPRSHTLPRLHAHYPATLKNLCPCVSHSWHSSATIKPPYARLKRVLNLASKGYCSHFPLHEQNELTD